MQAAKAGFSNSELIAEEVGERLRNSDVQPFVAADWFEYEKSRRADVCTVWEIRNSVRVRRITIRNKL